MNSFLGIDVFLWIAIILIFVAGILWKILKVLELGVNKLFEVWLKLDSVNGWLRDINDKLSKDPNKPFDFDKLFRKYGPKAKK